MICDMMGIPEDDQQQIFDWTNIMLGFGDPDLDMNLSEYAAATTAAGEYAHAFAEDRRHRPRVDLTTSLVQAESDGERLTSREIASFFLLVVAGNETAGNAISHGLLALTRIPINVDDGGMTSKPLKGSAVEEVVRWATPVRYVRRILKCDIKIRGVRIPSGSDGALWYQSANRDEAMFPNPWIFDVGRTPNPHLGYGGGVHFCLGSNLARREIAVVFEELHRQIPDITVTAEPTRLPSASVHGITHLPVRWTIG